MFVERSCEVDIEKLLVVDGQPHHPTSKPEVAQVIGIDVRQTVWLKCCTYDNNIIILANAHINMLSMKVHTCTCTCRWLRR